MAINMTDPELVEILIEKVSSLNTFLQAIGGIILIYLIFNIISLIMNRKKNKEIKEINHHLEEIKKLLKKKN